MEEVEGRLSRLENEVKELNHLIKNYGSKSLKGTWGTMKR